jgi:anti-sigma factor (TIGR02949 family)
MTRREIDCEEALGRLFAFLDHELADDEREAMQHHLSRCRGCFSRANFERRLKDKLHELREDKAASATERIEKLLQSF